MADIEFKDNRQKVKEEILDACIAFLHEASGEMISSVVRNFDKLKGHQWYAQQKNSYKYQVDEGELKSVIGSPMESVLWTEFGTGKHAQHGDGRKGYWVYVKGSDGNNRTQGGKIYTLAEAKRAMRFLQEKGYDAHITDGQEPKRPFQNAYSQTKDKIIKRAEHIFSDL